MLNNIAAIFFTSSRKSCIRYIDTEILLPFHIILTISNSTFLNVKFKVFLLLLLIFYLLHMICVLCMLYICAKFLRRLSILMPLFVIEWFISKMKCKIIRAGKSTFEDSIHQRSQEI